MLGIYVKYNTNPYVVVGQSPKMVKLNSPRHGRVEVGIDKVVPMTCPSAKLIEYRGDNYLVTSGNDNNPRSIVSCKTGKFMKWNATHGHRRAILYLVDRAA